MDDELRAALRGLQESLARIAAELDEAGRGVERVLDAAGPTGASSGPTGVSSTPDELATPPSGSPAVTPVIAWPSPPPAPASAQPAPGFASPVPGFVQPAPGFAPPAPGFAPPAPGFAQPAPGFTPPAPFPRPLPTNPSRDRRPGSWADTAGLQILGWVGGGVTVIGIVLLLVIASRDSGFAATARVLVGVVLGVALVLAGLALRRDTHRRALAVTVACTGLAVEFLTVVGATRLTGLVSKPVGFVASAVIVAVAVLLSRAWREPWLAGAAFGVGGLLAPVVGGGFTDSVLIFEAIMVGGGAACLLAGVGIYAWIGAAGAAAFTVLAIAVLTDQSTLAQTLIIAVIAAVAWATMLWRWWTGRAPTDPGPFPLRVPSPDPAQVARDYADYYAHQRLRSAARLDLVTGTASLIGGSVLLVLAVSSLGEPGVRDTAAGTVATILAVAFLAVTALARRSSAPRGPLRHGNVALLVAWSTTILLVASAVLSYGGDGDSASGVGWLLVAAAALAVAGIDRSVRLLMPGIGVAAIAVIATGTVVAPYQLLFWPSPSLVDPTGTLQPRAWAVVLPAGFGVLLVCALALWAVARCTVPIDNPSTGTVPGSPVSLGSPGSLGSPAGPGSPGSFGSRPTSPAGRPGGSSIADDGRWRLQPSVRIELLTWALVAAVVVGSYGILAVTMVVAYAISPDVGGYQGGQVAVTVLITIAGLVMAWQGSRHVVLRVGGLVLAAVAVGKLLLFDTRSLTVVPRALTFIGIGVLLLICAFLYLRATSRSVDAQGRDSETATAPQPLGPARSGGGGYPHG